MPAEFWIGDFFVDLTRNQITLGEQPQTLAPKALAVLSYLAQHQGKVVSQEALLSNVWQDVVVSPNTLQRSIAQLRRALGDDGKGQAYIKTHAKQGYSLECSVTWCDAESTIPPAQPQVTIPNKIDAGKALPAESTAHNTARSGLYLKLATVAAAVLILSVVGFQNLATKKPAPIVIDSVRLLTATDDKEFDPSYSPDGQHVVFHRYLDKLCVNKLWAKNITSQQEILLTRDWGAYGRHSFSEDGSKLTFLATEACNQPVTQKQCYDLVSLDFNAALKSPQQPEVLLQCKHSVVRKPEWLDNSNIALLKNQSDRWKLVNYSTIDNASTELYEVDGGNIIDYAYSPAEKLIAVISIHNDDRYYIDMLNADGRILSSNPIQRPAGMPQFGSIYPSFDPANHRLVFSTGRQLFALSYEGKVEKINTAFADRMYLPQFHPDGDRILMIKGPYDSDIVRLPLQNLPGLKTNGAYTYPSFERSNLGDSQAVFQPGGELVAFWSERSGEEQVWLSDGNGPRQLTEFPVDTYVRGIAWAADGQSLLVNANNVLTQVYLDSSTKPFPLKYPVLQLLHWDSENNNALMFVRVKGVVKLAEYDLSSKAFSVVTDKQVMWAQKDNDGGVIYKDAMDQFWRPGPVEDTRIEALATQGAGRKSFVVNGNAIFAINSDNELWSYNLDTGVFNILGQVHEDVDYLTDVNQRAVLLSTQISAKKEVVELTLGE